MADTGSLPTVQDQMSPQDIIRTEFTKYDYGITWQKMYAALYQMTKQPEYRILRSGNSLLFTQNDFKGNVFAILFNADEPSKMHYNMDQFFTALQKLKVKKLVIQSHDPQIMQYINQTGFQAKQAPDAKSMLNSASPAINVLVEL